MFARFVVVNLFCIIFFPGQGSCVIGISVIKLDSE